MNRPVAAIAAGTLLVLGGFLMPAHALAGGNGGTTTSSSRPVTTTTKMTYPTSTSEKPTSTTHATYPTTSSSMHVTTSSSMKPTTTTATTMKPTTTSSSVKPTTTSSSSSSTSTSSSSTTSTTTANMTLLTLRATVLNTHGGTATVDDFDLEAAGPVNISGITGAPAVTLASVPPGGYTLRDRVLVAAALGYTSSGWSCIGSADQTPSSVVLDAGEDAVCAIAFADAAPLAPGTLTVRKVLQGNAVGQQSAIDIATECSGLPLTPDLIIDAGFTPATSISRAYTGLPSGIDCTSTEIADGAAAGITVTTSGSPATATIVSAGTVVNTITDTVDTAVATTTTVAGATTTVPGAVTTVPGAATTSTVAPEGTLEPTAAETGTEAALPAAQTATTSLPNTGYDPSRMLEVAGAALILGGAGVALTRRRKHQDD